MGKALPTVQDSIKSHSTSVNPSGNYIILIEVNNRGAHDRCYKNQGKFNIASILLSFKHVSRPKNVFWSLSASK